jgi:NFU1 iron-sulfur cluster scaffold homolog, mitochondrial
MVKPPAVSGSRSIFIQTENTPNPDALKFLPNHPILPPGLSSPFIEYMNPRSTLAPPHPSPLAAQLMNIDGVTSVFYGADFITVTKAGDANWAHVKPEIFSLITEAVTSGAQIVNVTESRPGESGQDGGEEDSLRYNENDSEVVGMIKELLETRIRPAIQEDGGDIEFRGFEDGMVMLKLRGACRTCDSSTVTLKNGIEGMLMHYVSIWRNFLERLRLTNPD